MAGSVVYKKSKIIMGDEVVEEHHWAWVGDSADGTVPASDSHDVVVGDIILGLTNPGATAPTALYDVTITDAEGIDTFGTTLTDRSDTLSEQTRPGIASATDFGPRFVNSVLTLNIANQAVIDALGDVKIYVRQPR